MEIISDIQHIVSQARKSVYQHINLIMVQAYWLVGKRIVEEYQDGNTRAIYGKSLLKNISNQLQKELGKGFSIDNLENMRKFYLTYSLSHTLLPKSETASLFLNAPNFRLSWSHYLMLISIKDENERAFYEIESMQNNWSLRELKRQYNTGLYMRLALSIDKEGVKQLARKGQ